MTCSAPRNNSKEEELPITTQANPIFIAMAQENYSLPRGKGAFLFPYQHPHPAFLDPSLSQFLRQWEVKPVCTYSSAVSLTC